MGLQAIRLHVTSFPRRALVAVGVLLTALLFSSLAPPPPASAQSSDPAWGLVASTCSASSIRANQAAGLKLVEVEAFWDRHQPQRGQENADYVRDLRARVTACLDAGFRVVIGPGLQYPPEWVRSLPGAKLVDQRGRNPANGAVDGIFSAAVRDAQADYLRRLVAALPVNRLDGFRVGTSAAGEIGFPGPNEAGDGFLQSWWGFGPAPQQGTGLAADTPRTPMPGWIPGQKTWNGQNVTAAAARNWFLWYSRSLVFALRSQVDVLRDAGYTGPIQVPSPGKGVLPNDLNRAVNALLDGTGDRDGSLGRGLNYVDQFPVIAGNLRGPMVVNLTGVDDATAVQARRLNPPQDRCTANDASASVASGTPVERWSNLRFARAQAARADLPAVGENPGPPAAQTGGTSDSDSIAEQIRRSPDYARTCALAAFYLAFEWVLDDPSYGVTRQDYLNAIAARPAR